MEIKIFGTETQESIATWANETFGPVHQTRTTLSRANIEMAELMHAIWVSGDDAEVATEIADVIIVLCRYPVDIAAIPRVGYTMYDATAAIDAATIALFDALATRRDRARQQELVTLAVIYLSKLADLLKIDLPAAIDAKMKINRARRWRVKGGHGQHIDPKELAEAKLALAQANTLCVDALAKADGISLSAAMYTTRRYVDPSAAFCNHANECPQRCPCDPSCYCKSHTCRPR